MVKNINVFADIGAESISIGVAEFLPEKIVKVLYIKRIAFDQPESRIHSVLQSEYVFTQFINLVNQTEKDLNIVIQDVVFLIKTESMLHSMIQSEIKIDHNSTISINHMEKLAKNALQFFVNKHSDSIIVTDVLTHKYILNNTSHVSNPEKMSANAISLNASIYGVDQKITNGIESHISKFKIRPIDYIHHGIASFFAFKKRISDDAVNLYIDFGSINTSFAVVENETNLISGCVPFGGFDITRDISSIFNVSLERAKEIKISLSELQYKSELHLIDLDYYSEKKCTIYEINQVVMARVLEIMNAIRKQIKSFDEKLKIDTVYLTGGSAKILNITDIVSTIFHCKAKIPMSSELTNVQFAAELEDDIVFLAPLLGAMKFYLHVLPARTRAKYGYLIKTASKLTCFLRDLFY